MSDMHFGAGPGIFKNAKELRDNPTSPEALLWEKIRRNQLSGFKFRRQHPIANFIADFYCHEVRLVVELDGRMHHKIEQKDYDKGREHELRTFGIKVLRFKNEEVINDIESVVSKISRKMPTHP